MVRKRLNTGEMNVIFKYVKAKKAPRLLWIILSRLTEEEKVKYGIIKQRNISMVNMSKGIEMIDMSDSYVSK